MLKIRKLTISSAPKALFLGIGIIIFQYFFHFLSQNLPFICLISESRKEVHPIFGNYMYQSEQKVTVHDFQSLFEKHYPAVYRHVYFLTQNKSAAEDISQETFIKLYNSCPISLKNPGAWLTRVATNLTYNYLNGEKRRRDKEATQHIMFLVKPETSEEVVLKKEESDTVKKLLGTLPVKDRMCLLLRFSGFSYEEIAEAVHIPKSSVGKTLARAQSKFREAYLKTEGSEIR